MSKPDCADAFFLGFALALACGMAIVVFTESAQDVRAEAVRLGHARWVHEDGEREAKFEWLESAP